MKWIGLTGGLASGKSTVAGLLRMKGYPVIDADEIAKKVVERGTKGQAEVLRAFGQDLLLSDGSLDRRTLGQRVFGDAEKLKNLESIVHPLVQNEVQRQRKLLASQGFAFAFYDVPLLFEKNLSGFDAIATVTTDEVQQIARMKSRNGWTDQEIRQRLASQIPLIQKEKQSDYVIKNDGTLATLEKQVDDLIKDLVSDLWPQGEKS